MRESGFNDVPNNWVLGIWILADVVEVLGTHMLMRHVDLDAWGFIIGSYTA